MTKYNNYAQKLDAAFKEARDQYAALAKTLEAAKTALDSAKAWRPDADREEQELAVARANIAYKTAENALRNSDVWERFNQTRRELRAGLETEVKAGSLADPAALDAGAMTLLQLGALTVDDFYSFANRFDNNPTMLRVISKYAADAAASLRDDGTPAARRDAAALNALSLDCRSGQGKTMSRWDELETLSDYCSGQTHRGEKAPADHTVAMGKHWEKLTADAVRDF